MDLFWLGGEGPKELPWSAHRYLVTMLSVPSESLKGLRSLQKVGFWDGRQVTFIRIYDPLAVERTVKISDFASLDLHPQLILYEGYWEKASDFVFLERRAAPGHQSH